LDQSLRHAGSGGSVCPDPSDKKLPEIAKNFARWINKNLTVLFVFFFFLNCSTLYQLLWSYGIAGVEISLRRSVVSCPVLQQKAES
jgi:hypothetical protein